MSSAYKHYFPNASISDEATNHTGNRTQDLETGIITGIAFDEGRAAIGKPAALTLEIQYSRRKGQITIEGEAIERFFKQAKPKQAYYQDAQHLATLAGTRVKVFLYDTAIHGIQPPKRRSLTENGGKLK